MVDSVAEMVGFQVAALSVAIDGELVTMAYTGPDEHRDFVFDNADPLSILDPIDAAAHRSGRFRFLPAEEQRAELEGHWVVVMDPPAGDAPDTWDPGDVLMAFLSFDDGRIAGVLSLDVPLDGRRPDAATLALLERYAAQAERAVLTAFEREDLVRQIAHADAARRLTRAASLPARASLDAVIAFTHAPLVEGFGATGSWMHVFDPAGRDRTAARTRDGASVEMPTEIQVTARRLAPLLWASQRVLVVADGVASDLPPETDDVVEQARSHVAALGLASALGVPLGAGSECLGFLVLTRRAEDPTWTAVEAAALLEIGHDLGAALMTARALEGERQLVRELQQLDDHRTQLIATLSHELRTPLTVISGNLELLGELSLDDLAAHLQQAMTRGTRRMQKVVDDLLLLAQVSDPQHPLQQVPVDLGEVVQEVCSLVETTARAKRLRLDVDLAPGPLLVAGDPAELDRLIGNLVSNAVKYTPEGGTVSVTTSRRGESLVVRVSDDGLGISEEDQIGLFRPFFRTSNPDALLHPGTGLGLAIVATIIERHGGAVEVDSRLGRGTTFTVVLPADGVPVAVPAGAVRSS
ncbi:hypothetical protein GCM10023340_06750 [Nocardioides marinquilinus]|uniref:histidine kinase n=2 Tax=Nocardioides marinquilinus TaxID=1210400 RepID=A0ABP9PAX3_9ACTN